jgi:hypothetical protein
MQINPQANRYIVVVPPGIHCAAKCLLVDNEKDELVEFELSPIALPVLVPTALLLEVLTVITLEKLGSWVGEPLIGSSDGERLGLEVLTVITLEMLGSWVGEPLGSSDGERLGLEVLTIITLEMLGSWVGDELGESVVMLKKSSVGAEVNIFVGLGDAPGGRLDGVAVGGNVYGRFKSATGEGAAVDGAGVITTGAPCTQARKFTGNSPEKLCCARVFDTPTAYIKSFELLP